MYLYEIIYTNENGEQQKVELYADFISAAEHYATSVLKLKDFKVTQIF